MRDSLWKGDRVADTRKPQFIPHVGVSQFEISSSLRKIFEQRHDTTDQDYRADIHQKAVEFEGEIDSIKVDGRQF